MKNSQKGEVTIIVAAVCFVAMTLYTLADGIDRNRAQNEAVQAENAELREQLEAHGGAK